ncbi:MAG: hypothetical protein OEW08_07375 [Gammaproteobacteria bacterium]|nr:hypothetical protein [Gammaproteobacteria bacterium]
MLVLEDLSFHIQRDSHAHGSVCTVWYTYALHYEGNNAGKPVELWVDLWGDGLLRNHTLGDSVYDDHRAILAEKMTHERHFPVPCNILNEEIGMDEIFLRLHATLSDGREFTWDSAVVRDRF